MDLIVVRSFGAYAPGDRIADPTAARDVLASEHADFVVRVEGQVVPSAETHGRED